MTVVRRQEQQWRQQKKQAGSIETPLLLRLSDHNNQATVVRAAQHTHITSPTHEMSRDRKPESFPPIAALPLVRLPA